MLKVDREVMLEAVKQKEAALELLSKEVVRSYLQTSVQSSGCRYVQVRPEAPEHKADREVVLEAVKQKGHALSFATPEHKTDYAIVLEAVAEAEAVARGIWPASAVVTPVHKADREVVPEAVKQN